MATKMCLLRRSLNILFIHFHFKEQQATSKRSFQIKSNSFVIKQIESKATLDN